MENKGEFIKKIFRALGIVFLSFYLILLIFLTALMGFLALRIPSLRPTIIGGFFASLFLLIIFLIMIFSKRIIPPKITESKPLMKLRMETYFIIIIFFFSIGFPVLIGSVNDIKDNLNEFVIGGVLVIFGIILFLKEYMVRYVTLERGFVKSNKINLKKNN